MRNVEFRIPQSEILRPRSLTPDPHPRPPTPDSCPLTPDACPPDPANLIVGVLISPCPLTPDPCPLLDSVRAALESRFGSIDDQSELIPFDFTRYYEPEMGPDLLRTWFSFNELRPPVRADPDACPALVDDKLATIQLESLWRTPEGRRKVNLDPGHLTMHNLVLATTKNYAHRVFLGLGIYAELTLLYEHGKFAPLKWTYPDYRSRVAQDFLSRVRDRYLLKLRPPATDRRPPTARHRPPASSAPLPAPPR